MDAIRTGQQSLHVNVDIRYEDGFGSTQVSTSYVTYAGPMGWRSNVPVYRTNGKEEKSPPEKSARQK